MLLQGLYNVVFGARFIVCERSWICEYVNMCHLLLILLSFNVSGKLSPGFLNPLPPWKHLEKASASNPFTHKCTAIIEFLLFFRVICKKPSPLAIFMCMVLQFKVWMTVVFWWVAFMTTPHQHRHTNTQPCIHTNVVSVTRFFHLLMTSFV